MMRNRSLYLPITLLLVGWPAAAGAQARTNPSAIFPGESAPAGEPAALPPPGPPGPPAVPYPYASPPLAPVMAPATTPYAATPPAEVAVQSMPAPPRPDVERTKTQWFALNSYSGAMTSGHPLAGGALRLFRLRQTYSYVTLVSLRAARTTLAHGTAGYLGAFMQGGLKLTAGSSGASVFYLGVEAGYGISGYTIRNPYSKQQVGIHASPHIEYNFHFTDGVALVLEIKVQPPLGRLHNEGENTPSLWSFGGGGGLAF